MKEHNITYDQETLNDYKSNHGTYVSTEPKAAMSGDSVHVSWRLSIVAYPEEKIGWAPSSKRISSASELNDTKSISYDVSYNPVLDLTFTMPDEDVTVYLVCTSNAHEAV